MQLRGTAGVNADGDVVGTGRDSMDAVAQTEDASVERRCISSNAHRLLARTDAGCEGVKDVHQRSRLTGALRVALWTSELL
jgi:hypothetical protein